jgi:hypothetical protein
MLAISTDMQTPKDLDVVSVFVTIDGIPKFDYLGAVSPNGSLALPATPAIERAENPSAPVHIRVIGFRRQDGQENARVLRDVLTTVPSQGTALLHLPLDFLDDGSGQGTLPAQYVPNGPGGAPEGPTQFQPSMIASSCDPMNLCNTFGGNCQTMINGVCGNATVNSATLPAYGQGDVPGDGGITGDGAPASCFDVQSCFANPTPLTTVNGQGMQACSFPLPTGANPSNLNVALVTPTTGACLPSGCYVPLPNDPAAGWTVSGGDGGDAAISGGDSGVAIQGSTVILALGICMKLGSTTTLAVSSGPCSAEYLSQPVCEPTTEGCGSTGQTCCGTSCNVGNTCVAIGGNSECEACGGPGQVCCTTMPACAHLNDECLFSGALQYCLNNTGSGSAPGQAGGHCTTSCTNPTYACVDNGMVAFCLACGSLDGPCCAGSACGTDLLCSAGTCE